MPGELKKGKYKRSRASKLLRQNDAYDTKRLQKLLAKRRGPAPTWPKVRRRRMRDLPRFRVGMAKDEAAAKAAVGRDVAPPEMRLVADFESQYGAKCTFSSVESAKKYGYVDYEMPPLPEGSEESVVPRPSVELMLSEGI